MIIYIGFKLDKNKTLENLKVLVEPEISHIEPRFDSKTGLIITPAKVIDKEAVYKYNFINAKGEQKEVPTFDSALYWHITNLGGHSVQIYKDEYIITGQSDYCFYDEITGKEFFEINSKLQILLAKIIEDRKIILKDNEVTILAKCDCEE